jgi:hypothetical protein
MHQVQGTLTPTASFDFDKSLEFLSHFRPAVTNKNDDDILPKVISINGEVGVFGAVHR